MKKFKITACMVLDAIKASDAARVALYQCKDSELDWRKQELDAADAKEKALQKAWAAERGE